MVQLSYRIYKLLKNRVQNIYIVKQTKYFQSFYCISIIFLIFNLTISLSGCSSFSSSDGPPNKKLNAAKIKSAIPKSEPISKYGNPKTYSVFGKRYHTLKSSKDFEQIGTASWYGTKFHGRRTSSGEPYDMYAMTAAHKTLPLPTYVKVTNLENNKTAIVKVNDRGPFIGDRILDLSYAAATKLGVVGNGTAKIQLTAIDPRTYNKKNTEKLITMQLASFADRKNALQLVTSISKDLNLKWPVKLKSERNIDKSIYKVLLGPFPATRLKLIKSKLAKLDIVDPIMVIT